MGTTEISIPYFIGDSDVKWIIVINFYTFAKSLFRIMKYCNSIKKSFIKEDVS